MVAGIFLSSFINQMKAQCNSNLNADPVTAGTYYGSPGAVMHSTGKVNDSSNGPVVFQSNNSITLLPGFQAQASSSVTFTAQIQTLPHKLDLSTFEYNGYPSVEPQTYTYNFAAPVASTVLTAGLNYLPCMSTRYFISLFGPRYKDNVPNGSFNFDFHQGEDIVDGDIPPSPQDNIICMCTGVVVSVDNVDGGAADPEGKWIKVMCDKTFEGNPDWGNIFMAYRHLDQIDGPPGGGIWSEGDSINLGDLIGTMGETGTTENIHLHFSVQRKYCDISNSSYDKGTFYNVHPMRVFNPLAYQHLLDTLHGAELYLLDYSANSALFRLAVPYNQASIRAIHVSLPDGSYRKDYDFEKVSEVSAGEEEIRDQIEFVDGLRLYPYPFNRGQSAYDRYISKSYPQEYPGSTQRGYSIPNKGIFTTPAYVLDIELLDLPAGYCLNDLQISVVDIWGNGMKTTGNHAPKVSLFFNPTDPTTISTRYVADNDLFLKTNETVEISASAFDLDGTVSQVELFINGSSFGVSNSAPYNFNVAASVPAFNNGSWNNITAEARDNDMNISRSNTLRVYITENNLLTRRLTQNAADAEERKNDGTVTTTTSYDLDLCFDGNGIKQYTGLWFNNVGIPKNAIIEKAYLQFVAKDADCGSIDINIRGEAADNPIVFNDTPNNISARTPTEANITWSPGCWRAGTSEIDQRSSDIKTIVQEIVSRNGWTSNNNMVFILENDNNVTRRQTYSYHGCDPLQRKLPRLIVEYSPAPSPLVAVGSNQPGDGETIVYKNALLSTLQLRLSPNPNASNILTFEFFGTFDQVENLTLTITNLMGQTIVHHKTSTPAEGKFDLDISDLAPGTYSITLNLDGQLVTRKLIRL